MYGNPTIPERFRDRENEVYLAFWAKDKVRYLGASEGRQVIRKADVE